MGSPAKPFACVVEDCGMTFTNEDHLTVHSKKHDMALQLGLSQKATAFPADQTPTPTRFIRNCEEVGLFQDLQNVNPFDEGFKRAMEAKTGMLISLDSAIAAATSDDALHTPHIFPNLTDGQETTLFNTRKDIPKRSSGDESSTVVESSTKHTNETTRNIENDQNINSDKLIKFHSNTQICKADYSTIVSINEGNYIKIVVNKDISDVIKKDVMLTDAGKVAPPIISQQSLDFAIDSLTSHVESKNVTNDNLKKHNLIITSNTDNKNADVMHQNVSQQYISSVNSEQNSVLNIDTLKKKLQNALQTVSSNQTQTLDNKEIEIKKRVRKRKSTDIDVNDQKNYEVMIKLPNGELVHMKSNAIEKPVTEAKQKLKDALENKIKNGSEQLAALKDADTINAVMPVITTDNIPVLAVYGNVVHKKATVLNGSVDNNMLRLPKLAPAPANVYPVALVRRKVAIPAFEKVDMTPYKNNTLRSKSVTKMPRKCKRKSQEVTEKPIQHKSDCEIFEKLYGQCNKNCGENDKNTPVDDNDGIKDTSKTVTSDGKVENVIETHLNITETPEKPEKTNSIVYKVPNYYETNTNTDKVTSNAITTTKSNALNTFPNTHLVIHSATVVNTYNLNPSILVSDTVKSIDVPSSNNKTGSITLATQRPAKDIPTYNIVASEKIKPKQTEAEFKREMSAAAVKRYRTKQLLLRQHLIEENKILMENNQKLSQALEKRKSDMATLKKLFIEHLQSCSTASELREKYAELFEPKTQAEKNDNG